MEAVKARKRRKNIILSETGVAFGLFVIVFILFLAFPKSIRNGVSSGLDLCASAVLPSLFPYAVLSSYFVYMEYPEWVSRPFSALSRKLFRSEGEVFSVWLTGMVAGFPIGGRTAAKMHRLGQIDKASAEKAAAFSNCPSPAFVIAFCGGVFESPYAGMLLFLLLCLSSFLGGMAVCRLFHTDGEASPSEKYREERRSPPSTVSAITRACVSGGETMVTVCSYVVFFSALLSLCEGLLFSFAPLDGSALALFRGVFELTSGISCLNLTALSQYWLFVAASFMLSLSGLCANMQVISFLNEEGLSVRPYLVGRVIITAICTCLALLVGLLL